MNSPKLTIRLPQKDLDKIGLLVKAGIYETKCDLVRAAIQQLLTDAMPEPESRSVDSKGVMG